MFTDFHLTLERGPDGWRATGESRPHTAATEAIPESAVAAAIETPIADVG